MDEIDRKLMLFLAENPRMPYRELADKLEVSVQAIHRRIQVLMKKGVIRNFSAAVSIRKIQAVPVMVFGRSDSLSNDDMVKKLGEHEMVSSVLVAGGNFIYASGLLKSVSDLEKFTDFVKRTAEIDTPTVGIYSTDAGLAPDFMDGGRKSSEDSSLSSLDMKIIGALQADGREAIADIATELGVSAKTVSRRLEKMIEEGSIDLIVPMDPTFCGDIVSLVHLILSEGADKRVLGTKFVNRFSPRVWYLRSFSNLPNFLMAVVCTDTMIQLKEILDEISKYPGIKTVIPNIWYKDYIFKTWRDRLPAQSDAVKK